MSENNQKTYEQIRQEIEDQCRAQLQDEVRKRKEIEEKYYKVCEDLAETSDKLEKTRLYMMELASSNRDLMGCKMSFFNFMNTRRIYRKREKDLLQKDMEFWGYVFDPVYYAENNPDVVEKVGNDEKALLEHFICLGIYQGRQGSADFNVEKYLEYNDDLAGRYEKDKRDAYIHYVMYGKDEMRRK